MIPTMQPPTTGWNPEAQHVRSNGVGRQVDGMTNAAGYGAIGAFPFAGYAPTMTPFGTPAFAAMPNSLPFVTNPYFGLQYGATPFNAVPMNTIPTPFNTVPMNTIPTPFGMIPTPVATPFGLIPTPYGVVPTAYGMNPSINPFGINPLLSATMGHPIVNALTTNPYHIAALNNCVTNMCVPSVAATIPTSYVAPAANLAFGGVGNPFFRSVGTVGGIDIHNAILANQIPGIASGITGAAINPFATTPAFRTAPLTPVIPTSLNTIGSTWNTIPTNVVNTPFGTTATISPLGTVNPAFSALYGNTLNPITNPFVAGIHGISPVNAVNPYSTSLYGTPFNTITNPFITGLNGISPVNTFNPYSAALPGAITNPFIGAVNNINPYATIQPWALPGLNNPWTNSLLAGINNPLTNALFASNCIGACQTAAGFQPIGASPFVSTCGSIGSTPWNTASISGITPHFGTPTFIPGALTNPTGVLTGMTGCTFC